MFRTTLISTTLHILQHGMSDLNRDQCSMQCQVFEAGIVFDGMKLFDWLAFSAARMKHHFPEDSDSRLIQQLISVAIRRFDENSITCGLNPMMEGRVLVCMSGRRFLFGMMLETLFASFRKQFSQDPQSLEQCATWLRTMSLEDIVLHGFFYTMQPGDVMVLPHSCLVLECCLGQSKCDMISWPCLLPGGTSWRTSQAEVRKYDAFRGGQSPMVDLLLKGMDTLEKLLLLCDVKMEPFDSDSKTRLKYPDVL